MLKTNKVKADPIKPSKLRIVTTRDLPVKPVFPPEERQPAKIAVSTRSIEDVTDAQEQKGWKDSTLEIMKQRAVKKKKQDQMAKAREARAKK